MNKSLMIVPLLLLSALPVSAQLSASKVAAVAAAARPASVMRGGKGILLVTVSIGPKYHINANKPSDPAYIPTVFSSQSAAGITFGPAHYPAVKTVKVSYSPKPLLVYTGRAVIAVPFTVARTARPGTRLLAGTLSYQGCDAQSCYPPATAPVKASVTIK